LNIVNVNKTTLVKKIIARLTENLELLQKAAQASHAEATHESSKAENKYDTRGLEAAYLAGGQARQAKEIQDSITSYESLMTRQFSTGDPIDLSAVVDLKTDGALSTYFVGPKAGGLEIEHGGREILVITPQSPLGKNLIGRKSGERWVAELNGLKVKYDVVSVG
jgi:transcription elongation GreA/GreB family factor